LVALQVVLSEEARRALATSPWTLTEGATIGGCFLAYATGESGPGHAGDRAWAAAVVCRPVGVATRPPDVIAQVVVEDRVPASYRPGLLAAREGPVLAAAVGALDPVPDVLLVDATGLDHPRGAGLAVHVGWVTAIPTVGVTHRPLVGHGEEPPPVRGASAPVTVGDRVVARRVCTRTGTRAVVAHAGWRTDAETAAAVVLAASTEGARTPVPLQEARRVAREMRSAAEGRRR
jgi:deoxyribonuclease V